MLNANVNYKNEVEFNFGSSYSSYDGDHFGEVIWAEFASNSEIRDHYYDGDGNKNDFSVFQKQPIS